MKGQPRASRAPADELRVSARELEEARSLAEDLGVTIAELEQAAMPSERRLLASLLRRAALARQP